MAEKSRGMVVAAFVGDSLALGAHWIYDILEIKRRFGRVETLLKPTADSYHPTKDAGEFTHYGDQALVLLESMAERGAFDLDHFAARWRHLFEGYQGYFNHATKETLANFAAGKGPEQSGSLSSDLAGASRIAPIVYACRENTDAVVAAVRAQTRMTHDNEAVVQAAEFFARVTLAVLGGMSPTPAMESVSSEMFPGGGPLADAVRGGLESARMETGQAILKFGQSCDQRGGLPSVVHLLARHEADIKEALVENVMAGGDSAARGMLAGMVLGAHLGMGSIPPDWLAALKKRGHILKLLDEIK